MDTKIIDLSYKRRILPFVCFLLLSGFIASSLVSYYTTARMYQKQLSENILPLTGDNIYSEVQKDIVELVLISSLMANDTFLKDWVLSGEQETDRISKYLGSIKSKYHTVTCFFASDITHAYYYPDGIWTVIEKDNPRDAWYFRVKDIKDEYQINLGLDDINDSSFTIFVNYKVFDYEGEFMGVTGCGLTVENVQNLLNVYAKRYNRIIYFVDQDHRVVLTNNVAPPSFSTLDEVAGLKELVLSPGNLNPISFSYHRDNDTFLLNTRFIPELRLFLFVEQSLKDTQSKSLFLLLVKNFFITLAMGSVIIGAIFLTVQRYQNELELMATTDRLTRVNNRHSFEILMAQALKQAERESLSLSIILFDMDHFKKINDTYGHPAGDAVLKKVAATVRDTLRNADIVCRWGGEEFLILLQHCAREDGLKIAEQLRRAVARTIVHHDRDAIGVSISLGVTQWQKGESQKELIKRVDLAVYKAKENGRNRVEVI